MSDLLSVLAVALLPAAGNFGGALLAEFGQASKTRLNQALHAAAGIVIAIVAIELLPQGAGKAQAVDHLISPAGNLIRCKAA